MSLTPRLPFRGELRRVVLRTVFRHAGFSFARVALTLDKWEAGYHVVDIRCDEEAKGKGYGLETLCKCSGCQERKCFAFFDQMRSQFGRGGEEDDDE